MILLSNEKNNDEKNEEIKIQRKTDKLKSIFEKEKQIKNNNLFLGDRNNYNINKERDILNEQMAHQIHNLKKQLLGPSSKKN